MPSVAGRAGRRDPERMLSRRRRDAAEPARAPMICPTMQADRHVIDVKGRQVAYASLGEGLPVVLITGP